MKLEICIHCYHYEHRLSWMLSSILQQKGDKPDIVVSLSYLPGTGNPTSERVVEYFRAKGMDIIDVQLELGQETNRAIPRNIRAKECTADWILFADCDMVYDPYFFEDIRSQLETEKYKQETKVIGADRHSLDIEYCVKYFNEDARIYPIEIKDVANVVSEWPLKCIHGKNIAAGNFQLANVQAIKDKGGIYSGAQRDSWRSYRSDRNFRVHMGGRVPMTVKPMYHLNHDRSGPEVQR